MLGSFGVANWREVIVHIGGSVRGLGLTSQSQSERSWQHGVIREAGLWDELIWQHGEAGLWDELIWQHGVIRKLELIID
jgi:hypothetical protein